MMVVDLFALEGQQDPADKCRAVELASLVLGAPLIWHPVDPPREAQRPVTEVDLDRLIARQRSDLLAGVPPAEARLARAKRK